MTMTVHRLVEQQTIKSPDAIAVTFEGKSLSYRELNERANKVAIYLQSLGVKPNSLVGLCLDRSIDLVVGILGILKAGGAYLPLASNYPADRLQYMIEQSEASIILSENSLKDLLPQLEIEFVCLDSDWEKIEQQAQISQLEDCSSEDDLAYVIFTSGSTGKPKGAELPHKALVNLLKWQKKAFKHPAASTLQFTPISFDVSFQEIFSTLSCGGKLVLIDDQSRRIAEELLTYISEQQIERLFLPFVALQNLAEVASAKLSTPLSLQEVVTAGEQLKVTRSISKWFAAMNQCSLTNQYGPSESHVVSSFTLTGEPSTWPHLPPIGKAIENAELYVLNTELRRKEDSTQQVAAGDAGELAIGGVSLSTGYLNQPELTNSRFVPNPFSEDPNARLYLTGDLVRQLPDGNLQFIERIDNQVKIRGVRVELGELETLLAEHESIKDVVVIAREDSSKTKKLHAYIVPTSDFTSTSIQELEVSIREFLKQQVIDCMMPSTFTFLDVLPLTPSGKVDRRSLPIPEAARPALSVEFVAPSTDIEKMLADVWSTALEVVPVGTQDNFFDLGGDSLRAIQLVHKVRDIFKIDLPMVALFDAPSIAQLAQSVQTAIAEGETVTSDSISVADIVEETKIDDSIKAGGLPRADLKQPKHVLITGVTGFLGVFLLQELLDKTQADIHCLTRAKDPKDAKQQIIDNLKKYGLWSADYQPRILPVAGDLAKPALGLSNETWVRLAESVDVIYHSGASISLINPYASMRAANVLGTQELLKLASQVKLKPFHFISTLDVFQTSEYFSTQPITEADPLNPEAAVYFDGYTKSKWVSEQMVWAAKEQGLPVCVYRPAMISGHSETGIANKTDLMNRLIKGFIQLGCAPSSQMVINIAPVNFFSQGVIYLSQQEASIGKSFNFINPNPVGMAEFTQAISDCGYPVELVDHAKWEAVMLENLGKFDGIVSVLTSKMSAEQPSYIERSSVNAWQVSCQNILTGLEATPIECPKINAEFLAPYLRYFAEIGFIESPTAQKVLSSVQ
ncbi:MAG: amino acid adenylation domain-containing protein [Cyanobacteria bacterium J06621_11]